MIIEPNEYTMVKKFSNDIVFFLTKSWGGDGANPDSLFPIPELTTISQNSKQKLLNDS